MELDYIYALKGMNFVERYPNLVFPINFLSWILITKSSYFFIFFSQMVGINIVSSR